MNPSHLPKDLQDDQRLQVAASAYPIAQTNPVTGYRTSLYRSQPNADFFGWITLINANQTAGYIYIRRPLGAPYVGSSGYVVMDITPDLLDALLRILQSGERLQISFYQGAATAEPSAFLEHRQ